MGSSDNLCVARTLIVVLVICSHYASAFFIRQKSVLTDIEPTESRPEQSQRKNLIDLLMTLQELENQSDDDIETPSRINDDSDKQDFNTPEKRDYGIMPPWNEMCRMMRVAFCVRHKKR